MGSSVSVGRWLTIGLAGILVTTLCSTGAIAQSARPNHQLALEPGIYTVITETIAQHPLAALTKMHSRSRWSASLPSVEVSIQRWDDLEWRGTTNQDQDWSRRSDRDSRIEWRIKTRWDLAKLVHSNATLKTLRALVDVRQQLHRHVQSVIAVYYQRRRLQLQFLDAQRRPERQAITWFKIQELTAKIDAQTNGLFQKHRVDWWKPEPKRQGQGLNKQSKKPAPESNPHPRPPVGD